MRFLVGQRVKIRGLLWEVVHAEGPDVLEVIGRDRWNHGRSARFLIPVDHPQSAEPPPWIPPETPEAMNAKALHALLLAPSAGFGRISLEPFQLAPVLRLLALPKPRLLIADDVGLGKTIEAGLALAEWDRRGKASRFLVVCPASMTEVWRETLRTRFGLKTNRFDTDALRTLRRRLPAHLNPWQVVPRVITSLDWAKQPHVMRALSPVHWDVVVIDECHHVALRSGKPSRRARLATLLASRTETLLLLSATPHDGSSASFASLLKLLNPTVIDEKGKP
ncbi:MAG: DEAD/DEAH box helicase, partial [Planctomycetota bacterium]